MKYFLPFYRLGYQGRAWLSHLSEITPLINDRPGSLHPSCALDSYDILLLPSSWSHIPNRWKETPDLVQLYIEGEAGPLRCWFICSFFHSFQLQFLEHFMQTLGDGPCHRAGEKISYTFALFCSLVSSLPPANPSTKEKRLIRSNKKI